MAMCAAGWCLIGVETGNTCFGADEIWSDRLVRVEVLFHWQQGRAPQPLGARAQPSGRPSNQGWTAKMEEPRASCTKRHATNCAARGFFRNPSINHAINCSERSKSDWYLASEAYVLNFAPAAMLESYCGNCGDFTDSFLGYPSDFGLQMCVYAWLALYVSIALAWNTRKIGRSGRTPDNPPSRRNST